MNLLKQLLFFIINPYFLIKFRIKIKQLKPYSRILFCDIDNSIADTWPLLKKSQSNSTVFSNVTPLKGTALWLSKNYSNYDLIIFISARNYIHYFRTKQWLLKNNFKYGYQQLILVPRASDKVNYFLKAHNSQFIITVLDDLSYNHENGNIQYYSPIIDLLKKSNITHLDYQFILSLNQTFHD